MKIDKNLITGFKWMGIFSILNVIMNPIGLIIFAFFVGASGLGEKSIVTIIITFSSLLSQFGIAQAIIQRNKITAQELNSLFWFNILLGCVLFISLFISAPYIAAFYNNSNLENLIKMSSLLFLIEPTSVMFSAILEKKLFFKVISVLSIVKTFSFNIIMVCLLYFNFEVYSYVYGQIVSVIIFSLALLLFFISKNMWTPNLYFSSKVLKPFLTFGIFVTGKNLLNFFGKYFDELIIGKILGFEELGIYHLAKQVIEKAINLITTNVNKVCYPLYANAQSSNNILYFKEMYLNNTKLVSFFGFPFFGLLVVLIPNVINIYGEDSWKSAVFIMQIFAFKGMIDILSSGFASSALYAFNKPATVFNIDLIVTPVRILLIVFAVQYNIEIVALTYALVVLIKSIVLQNVVNKEIGINMKTYFNSFSSILLITLLVVGITISINIFKDSIPFTLLISFLFLALYNVFAWRKENTVIKSVLKEIISKS